MRRPPLLLSGLLIWAVGPLMVQGKEKKTPPSGTAPHELKFHTAKFQPGKLGIGADWNSGRVTRVDKGGQGEEKKVKVGMVIDKVDGKNYHESLLDKRIAGSNAYEITFKVLPPPAPPAPPPPPKDGDLPPVPDFKYATVLTPETFKTMVYDQTNGSQADAPKYYPIVMFHVSWCKHCRHALPEYEKAAEMVAEQAKQRRSVLSPRLFLIECDKPPEHKPVCEEHVGSNYPVIKAFRDDRALHFNRPRQASTFAWWAMHVTKPPMVEYPEDEPIFKSPQVPIFILHCDRNDKEILNTYREVALDNIEDHIFAYVPPGSSNAKGLQSPPSVTVRGPGLDPLPFENEITRDALAQWVKFNQFPVPLVTMGIHTYSALKKCGYAVVTLVYNKEKDQRLYDQFEFKAKQLRQNRQFIFSAVNIADKENEEDIAHIFPLMNPNSLWTKAPPRIFAFMDDTYWEDPSMVDPSMLSLESIGALLANTEARQEKGNPVDTFKEKKKMLIRFCTGSSQGMFAALATLVAILALSKFVCIPCVIAIFASDDEFKKD